MKFFGTHTQIWQPGHRLVRGVTGKVIWLVLYVKGIFRKMISTYLDTSSLKILPKICRFTQLSLHCTAGKATGNNLDDEDYVPEVPESPDPDSTLPKDSF